MQIDLTLLERFGRRCARTLPPDRFHSARPICNPSSR
jgi:hypothetical protein